MDLAYWRTVATPKLIEAALVPPSIDFNELDEWMADLPHLARALAERLRDVRDEGEEAIAEATARATFAGSHAAHLEDVIYALRHNIEQRSET